ncbi:hypothetical protein [Streptomyces sp. NPDC127190]|uniref:hypothetical protein n=1 Tax=unclassified Streptomyces TaxID=2593676 RepID=UPI003642A344
MARNTVRIGGDAHGPVVAGNDNKVEMRQDTPSEAAEGAGAPTQNNTAKDHGTVFSVMNGELHLHHDHDRRDHGRAPESSS